MTNDIEQFPNELETNRIENEELFFEEQATLMQEFIEELERDARSEYDPMQIRCG